VDKGKILANVKDTYTTEKGGIIPQEAAKHHKAKALEVYQKALETAKINEKEISAIAYSHGPGLAPCLLAGLEFAKALAEKLKIPLVPVNHCVAHLEIGRITGAKDPILLYASGANTQIISYEAGKYRIFGETLDIGIGNFIDTFARSLGVGFPGGPKIAQLAEKSKNYVEIPYSIKGMDVAFSGMLTNLQQKIKKKQFLPEDLAYSLQETAFAMLVEASERAMAHTGKQELLLGGGVACNKRLQQMCEIMCKERQATCFCPPCELLTDNGGMIAFLGEIMFNAGIKQKTKNADVNPKERTDDIQVTWR